MSSRKFTKVAVIGLDGLEGTIVDRLLAAGELPNLQRLREQGGYARVATTAPAQTPVAWSSFATGTNPGGHGIFDFVRRHPANYMPDVALTRYEQKNAFTAPKAVNLRRGETISDLLSKAGVPSVVLRMPCTYPAAGIEGSLLAGMGVPDIRGGLGTYSFYTSVAGAARQESEHLIAVPARLPFTTRIIGPRNPKDGKDLESPIEVEDAGRGRVRIKTQGKPQTVELGAGEWSPWVHVRFKLGLLQAMHGMVRFHLIRCEGSFEMYASPVNFDPAEPLFPISSPPGYAKELASRLGDFYTTGMVEDHGALNNGRFSEEAYVAHCEQVLAEREKMCLAELDRTREGFFYCLFDTPDRLQHMLWRFTEPGHPANRGEDTSRLAGEIDRHYRLCDRIAGEVMQRAGDDTLLIVMSDHGMNSFRRGVHLNSLLHSSGLLAMKPGCAPGPESCELFRNVDWSRTQAYALGLGSIYLNLKGREGQGCVAPEDRERVGQAVQSALGGFRDPATGEVAIRRVAAREDLYSGPYVSEAPDLVACFSRGYRVSWATALGGVPAGECEDNVKKWSGDHIIDPDLVPGVLFSSRPFTGDGARLIDLAPTILEQLGVPKGDAMEGSSLMS